MGKLIDENGTEYTNTTEILNHQKQFYESLYDDIHNTDNRSINDMLGEIKNKLTNQAAEQLEDKNRFFLKNWRPISLLNVNY